MSRPSGPRLTNQALDHHVAAGLPGLRFDRRSKNNLDFFLGLCSNGFQTINRFAFPGSRRLLWEDLGEPHPIKKLMKNQTILSLALALASTAGVLAGNCNKPGLDQELDFSDSGVNYTIYYTTNSGTTHRITHARAQELRAQAISSYDRLVNVMNFRSPYLNTLPDFGFVVKDDWYYSEPGCVVMHAPGVLSDPESSTRCVLLHERFHTVQRHYKCDVSDCNSGYIGDTFGKWVSEGTADAVMDKGYLDCDDGTGWPFFEASGRAYLANPGMTLFDQEYHASLWWTYLMEQLGTVHAEPQYGVDFMVDFWDQVAANGAAGSSACLTALRQSIASRTTRSLENLFLDFAVCNYTREYDASALLSGNRYSYVDEQTQPFLGDVPKTAVAALPFTRNNEPINSYAAKYFEYEVSDVAACDLVGFKAENAPKTMGFAAVAVDAAGKVIALRSSVGRDFAASFFNSASRPIRRLCGIAVGLADSTHFDCAVDHGGVKVSIVRPTFSHPAYPGPHDHAGNVLVRLMVIGPNALTPGDPGTLSVLGLQRDDFAVRIAGLNAPVVDASYVGGEYQLLVNAPDPGADGAYDLDVTLCTGPNADLHATSRRSVQYGDLRFHHAVCLDISGSMEYPTSAKLDAAKQAAKFYIDAVNDNDKLTVVTFSGNGTECNEDATNLSGLNTLVTASGLAREQLKHEVEGLNSVNLTSIGDGLWTSQDALDTAAAASTYEHFDNILLLSDGLENEARYWARTNCIGTGTVADRISATESMVSTIAFGADADLSLMQQIATSTEGDYSYIAVDPSVAALGASLSSLPSDAAMQNQLTLSFLQGLERARHLQRLAFDRELIGKGAEAKLALNLTEEGVTEAILFVGWSQPGSMSISITDPTGVNPVSYASAKYEDKAHLILHFPKLKPGLYQVGVLNKSGVEQECFAGISGIPGSNLRVRFTLSPHKTGGTRGRPEGTFEQFEQGLPVDLRAQILDYKGPVLNAKARLEVTLPDGEKACDSLLLFDDGQHVDGNPEDGVYGLRYTRTPQAGYKATDSSERPKLPANPKETGNYHLVLTVNGRGNDGAEFTRVIERDFKVYQRQELVDSDRDGLPDTWEVYYGTDPLSPDADKDPDLDGLSNKDEFQLGTHPFDPDTDAGGESDGSEVKAGRCPLNPVDDRLPALEDVSIIASSLGEDDPSQIVPNALMLVFPDHPAYRSLQIYRSTDPDVIVTAANLIQVLDLSGKLINNYLDRGLIAGKRYYYQLRAIGANDAATPFSRVLTGVPKADPMLPTGHIVINHGAAYTDSSRVLVQLIAGPGVKAYRLSQKPFTGLETYRPLVNQTEFTFPILRNGQTAIIYVQFLGSTGNESPVTDATIAFWITRDNDRDSILDPFDPDDDNDSLSDDEEIFKYGTDPLKSDTDGDGYSDGAEVKAGSDPLDRTSVPPGSGKEDSDQDGYPNNLESAYGTDQKDPRSYPDIRLQIIDGLAGYQVAIRTVKGVIYQFQTASDLNKSPIAWTDLGDAIPGNGQTQVMVLVGKQTQAFIRVAVRAE
jgi:hypothetical protein